MGVPEESVVTIEIGPVTYWEEGLCNLMHISVIENGEVVAGADYNPDTKEPVKEIMTYIQ